MSAKKGGPAKGASGSGASKAGGSGAGARVALPGGTHKQTPGQVAERVVQNVVPQTTLEIIGNLLNRNPILVLSVCGVLIILEVVVIAGYVSGLGDDPLEAKYYNRARVTTRDLDRKAVEQIPSDSLASGVHNPVEDVFTSESEGRPGTTNTDERIKNSNPNARPAAVDEALKQAEALKHE